MFSNSNEWLLNRLSAAYIYFRCTWKKLKRSPSCYFQLLIPQQEFLWRLSMFRLVTFLFFFLQLQIFILLLFRSGEKLRLGVRRCLNSVRVRFTSTRIWLPLEFNRKSRFCREGPSFHWIFEEKDNFRSTKYVISWQNWKSQTAYTRSIWTRKPESGDSVSFYISFLKRI